MWARLTDPSGSIRTEPRFPGLDSRTSLGPDERVRSIRRLRFRIPKQTAGQGLSQLECLAIAFLHSFPIARLQKSGTEINNYQLVRVRP
jgi:hypothetical protein